MDKEVQRLILDVEEYFDSITNHGIVIKKFNDEHPGWTFDIYSPVRGDDPIFLFTRLDPKESFLPLEYIWIHVQTNDDPLYTPMYTASDHGLYFHELEK